MTPSHIAEAMADNVSIQVGYSYNFTDRLYNTTRTESETEREGVKVKVNERERKWKRMSMLRMGMIEERAEKGPRRQIVIEVSRL